MANETMNSNYIGTTNDGIIIPETNVTTIQGRPHHSPHYDFKISSYSSYIIQRLSSISSIASAEDYDGTNESSTALDSHADSPVVGKNSVILEDKRRTAKVSGFT